MMDARYDLDTSAKTPSMSSRRVLPGGNSVIVSAVDMIATVEVGCISVDSSSNSSSRVVVNIVVFARIQLQDDWKRVHSISISVHACI